MSFMILKNAVAQQIKMMEEHGLLVTSVNKDDLWDTYLGSFKPEDNPKYKERTEHDCQCCKQFIRACGNVVAVIDGNVVSIWDVNVNGTIYEVVAKTMAELVKSFPVDSKYLHYQNDLGTDKSLQQAEDGSVFTWNHFHHKLKQKYVAKENEIPSMIGLDKTLKTVFKRALDEIDISAVKVVLELISQNSLYRGEEHEQNVNKFFIHKDEYDKLSDNEKVLYIWNVDSNPAVLGMRNSVIGTLMVDLSEGKELEYAVSSYEKKVAPENYKRPSALITKSMIDKAEKKVSELGIEKSLSRRYAHADDLKINNVIFANRDSKKSMGVFDEMKDEVGVEMQNFDKVEEVNIDHFIAHILPTANAIELMFENKHSKNLVSLIAPLYSDAPSILKWGNNFTWTYNGEVADSMKDRVKSKGGNVDGVLRFSIQWNDGDNNQNDFDAHCYEPNGNKIYFASSGRAHESSGMLDVDITNPGKNIAVENIIYTDINKMPRGKYLFVVHNYCHNGGRTGFTAEIEYNGIIHSYSYNKNIPNSAKIKVAEVGLDEFGFNITHKIDSEEMTKCYWNINTRNWQNVSMVMHSPNHWDGECTGNKHWFFILTDCKKEGSARGFYNEFLKPELNEHRKVFEVLGSKIKTEESENQLSGLGFSSTQRNSVLCKVSGSFNRVVKINF